MMKFYIQYPVCDTHAVNTHQVWAQTLNWTVCTIFRGPWVERSWSNPNKSKKIDSESEYLVSRYCVYWNRNAKAISALIYGVCVRLCVFHVFIIQNAHTRTLTFTIYG